jgi:sorbitol-specific phosphotransferase system component IIC
LTILFLVLLAVEWFVWKGLPVKGLTVKGLHLKGLPLKGQSLRRGLKT